MVVAALTNINCATRGPAHLAVVETLLENVTPANNSYTHHREIIRWGDEGEIAASHTDCSGLLNQSFMKAYGLTTNDMEGWMGYPTPPARSWYQAIADENRF